MFVPCVYSLITSKSEYMYLTVFYELIVLTKYCWMPQVITSDFEISLIPAIKHEFASISDTQLPHYIVKKKLLTIVTIQEIPRAIRYVNSLTTFFRLTWRRRFEPQLWNILNINDIDITGRKINAFERYKRELEIISLMHTQIFHLLFQL
ncbi:hypothetical protein HZS_1960 [Henneguya salminicola]|nr:hypothetical protein HZS_1960 [Henneguya salminicola]